MHPRIVGIISRPSHSGNTAVLVREALRAAAEHGAEVEEIFLPALATGLLGLPTLAPE
jgi:multimeric flavodoxin WrbA